jgi:hypothetical protein
MISLVSDKIRNLDCDSAKSLYDLNRRKLSKKEKTRLAAVFSQQKLDLDNTSEGDSDDSIAQF